MYTKHFFPRFFAFIIVFCGFAAPLRATHMMGGEITYKYLHNNTYQITYSFYRDCSGIPAPYSVDLEIYSPSLGITFTVNLPQVSTREITPLCISAQSSCNGGTIVGSEEYIYSEQVDMPANARDWQLSTIDCCRNYAITTIDDPGSQSMYSRTTMNNLDAPKNSSPFFLISPTPYLCLGQTVNLSSGAVDVDGDSLVYRYTIPRTASNESVTYLSGYNFNNFLSSSTPIKLDPLTGAINITPNKIQVSVMALEISEYRGGTLISQIVRDIQFITYNCNNRIPSLTGFDGSNVFQAELCAGTNNKFTVFSNDSDPSDKLNITIEQNEMNGGTISVVNTPSNLRPSAEFKWNPTAADVRDEPYIVILKVDDGYCDLYGFQYYTYKLYVRNAVKGNAQVCAGSQQETYKLDSLTNWTMVSSIGSTITSPRLNTNSVIVNFGYTNTVVYDTLKIDFKGECSSDLVIKVEPRWPLKGQSSVCTNGRSKYYSASKGNWRIKSSIGSILDGITQETDVVELKTGISGAIAFDSLFFTSEAGCDTFIVVQVLPTTAPEIAGAINACTGSQQVRYTANIIGNWQLKSAIGSVITGFSQFVNNVSINFGITSTTAVDTLILLNGSGCSDTLFISVGPSNLIEITGKKDICQPVSGSLYYNSNILGSWSLLSSHGSVVITYDDYSSSAFVYITDKVNSFTDTLIQSDPTGCKDTLLLNIQSDPELTDDFDVCSGSTVKLGAKVPGKWSMFSTNGSVLVGPTNNTDSVEVKTAVVTSIRTERITFELPGGCLYDAFITLYPPANIGPVPSVLCSSTPNVVVKSDYSAYWQLHSSIGSTLSGNTNETDEILYTTGNASGSFATDTLIAKSFVNDSTCTDTVFVQINPTQSPVILGPDLFCSSSSVRTYTSTFALNWSLVSSSGSSLVGPVTNVMEVQVKPGVTLFQQQDTLIATNGDCETRYVIDLFPEVELDGPTTICGASTQPATYFTPIYSGNWTLKSSTGSQFDSRNVAASAVSVLHRNVTNNITTDSLFFISDLGCRDTIVTTVLPGNDISGPSEVCISTTKTYQNPDPANWTLKSYIGSTLNGSAANVVSADYLSGTLNFGFANDTLIASSATKCADTLVIKVWAPDLIFGPSEICANVLASYNAATPGTWSIKSSIGSTLIGTNGYSSIYYRAGSISGMSAFDTLICRWSNGCSDSLVIEVLGQQQVSVTGPSEGCTGDQIMLTSNLPTDWVLPLGLTALTSTNNTTSITVSLGSFSTTQNLSIAVGNSIQCGATHLVQVNPTPQLNGPTTLCSFTSGVTYFSSQPGVWRFTGPGAAYVQQVSQQSTTLVMDVKNVPSILTLGIEQETSEGCKRTINATLHPLPSTFTFQNEELCENTGRIINAPSGNWTQIFWQNKNTGQLLSNTSSYFATVPVEVVVTAQNTIGCIVSDTFIISNYPRPTLDIDLADGCAGTNTVLSANGQPAGGTIAWYVDGIYKSGQSTHTLVAQNNDHNIRVTYTYRDCPTIEKTGQSMVLNSPIADAFSMPQLPIRIPYSQVMQYPFSFTEQAGNTHNPMAQHLYSWSFGDNTTATGQSVQHTYSGSGIFQVTLTVTDVSTQCTDTYVLGSIEVYRDVELEVPNVITPNEDGTNDDLVVTTRSIRTYSLLIFDRKGVLVFDNNRDMSRRWNGSVQNSGQQCPEGAYFYVLEATDFWDKVITRSGHVSILR